MFDPIIMLLFCNPLDIEIFHNCVNPFICMAHYVKSPPPASNIAFEYIKMHCIIVMAFSPRNIIGCFLKKRLTKGESRASQDPPSLRPCPVHLQKVVYFFRQERKLKPLLGVSSRARGRESGLRAGSRVGVSRSREVLP